MILQRLNEYYDLLVKRNVKIPPYGFQMKEIPFVIVLNQNGTFYSLQDNRYENNTGAKEFLVPLEKDRTSNIDPNILWDQPEYVFGKAVSNKKNLDKKHKSFIEQIIKIFGNNPEDPGVKAVLLYLQKGDFSDLTSSEYWSAISSKDKPNISFKLRGDDGLIVQRDSVFELIKSLYAKMEHPIFCLVSGKYDSLAETHPVKIKKMYGLKSSGGKIVSYNENAYESYGKKKGENAPIGMHAAFGYATALNYLIRSDDHRLRLGDVTVVFWSQKPNILEDHFATLFAVNTSRVTESEDTDAIRKVLTAPKSGILPEQELELPFYVLGLSPNAARISVRFWYEGSVGKTLENIRRYFDELRIVKRFDNESDFPTLGKLLLFTALEYKWDNIPPNLTGAFFLAALNGTRYPETLLSSVIRRIRAEASKTTITYERAALLKALLIRNHNKEITMSLDTTRNDPAYLLGRLFAVLEHLQSRAQGSLNASIRERYYGSASSTPIAVFPTLLKLSTHHLAKLDNPGLKNWYESLIQEILKPLQEWPTHLPLAEQAMFALGYYHQRAGLYTSKNDKTTEGENHE